MKFKRKWKKKILEITWEVFATPIDLVLFATLVILAVGAGPPDTIKGLSYRIDKILGIGSERIVRNALRNCRQRRWFKKDYSLTAEGETRLKQVILKVIPIKHWDGIWYMASYDIPNKLHWKRNILRENLKDLGFGHLQKSIWISPINYLGAVEEVVKHYKIEPYVILSETNRIGEEVSRDLANRVWKLDRLNSDYKAFIKYWENSQKEGKAKEDKNRIWPVIRYFSILKRDPQLPEELLPDDWHGFEAHEIMDRFIQKELKGDLRKILQ